MHRHLRARLRLLKRRSRRFLIHTVLHADDPPHRIAWGVAIAMFVTFTPTVGFQMVLAVFLAWLLGGNKAVCVPIVWISNPATIIPIYYLCYRIGRFILGGEGVGLAWWGQLTQPPDAWWPRVQFYWQRFTEIAAPLWIGSLIFAALAAYLSYYLAYYTICGYRLKRWGKLHPPLGQPRPAPQDE
jgi:uncharacterized protein (DUF2062 family)